MLSINRLLFLFFIIFFFQTYFNIFISFFFLFLLILFNFYYSLNSLNNEKIKIIIITLLLIVGYVYNILIHSLNFSLIKEMKYFVFYRYDGKLFVMPTIFILILFSIRLKFLNAVKIIIIGSNILLLLSLIIFILKNHTFVNFFSGPFKTHNAVGGFAASLILLSFYYMKYNKSLSILSFIISLICLFLSASRSFIVSTFLIFFINIIFFHKKYLLKFILFTVILFLVINLVDIKLMDRFLHPDTQDVFNVVFRVEAQIKAIKIFIHNFLFGIGIGNIDTILKSLIPYKTETEVYKGGFLFSQIHPHNTFLTILSEQGLVGFLLFIYVHLFFLRKAYIFFPRREFILVLNLFLILFIASFAGDAFFSPSNAGIYYIILAIGFNNFLLIRRK